MNVGSSKKRNTNNRGFRGIGRLGGMSYCDTLIFTTSAENEKVKTIVSFNCKKLRHLLVPGEYEDMSLSAVLEEITTIETFPEKEEKHYLCVEMVDVNGLSLIHISEPTRQAEISYAVFCLKKKNKKLGLC